MSRLLWLMIVTGSLVVGCGSTDTRVDPPDPGNSTGGTESTDSTQATDATGPCVPSCSGKECGANGCGGFCGVCPTGKACNASGNCAGNPNCQPKCDGKQCGPDGCGGFCGTCGSGTACNGAGKCVTGGTDGCLPACENKQCGPDGCGNLCGKCAPGQVCSEDGLCQADNSACGEIDEVGECQDQGQDSIAVTCKAGKLIAVVCATNKGLKCGFNPSKNKFDCIKDGCIPDCVGKQCGSDGCGGLCGQCKPTETCNAQGVCSEDNVCVANCQDKVCGPDGCGSICGTCGGSQACVQGACLDPNNCTADCDGKSCGSDGCGGSCGTCKPSEFCSAGSCKEGGCIPNCVGKSCGSDGCGGDCGECPSGQTCDAAGHCVTPGSEGCGNLTYEGVCDETGKIVKWCEDNLVMSQDCTKYGDQFVCSWVAGEEYYWCLEGCAAACVGKECGSDGCGGSCGACDDGKTCNPDGKCIAEGGGGACGEVSFSGVCEGTTLKYCNTDELKVVSCGELGKVCAWNPTFEWFECAISDDCTPNCLLDDGSSKECGDDGCGNVCGSCAGGLNCNAGKCVEGGPSECGDIDEIGVCEGDLLKYCISGSLYDQDCAASGQTCGWNPEGNGGEGWNDCIGDGGGGGETCGNGISSKGQCNDNSLLQCNGDTVKTTKCADTGKHCLYDPAANGGDGGYGCLSNPGCIGSCPADQKCQKDNTCGCDGITVGGICTDDTLIYCVSEKLTTVKCADTGASCVVEGSWADCK